MRVTTHSVGRLPIVQGALAGRPEERIATAEELRRRLEALRTAHADEGEAFLFDGCFELLEVLGVGAKAEVYRAYHRDARCYVALKLLSATCRESDEERRRFDREAQVLSAIRHPAIPEFFHCRTRAALAQPYIAMGLAKGRRASEHCVAGSTLSPAEVIAVGRGLAAALVHLHERGIHHRDLSPSNVLIDLERREPRATLIDFGMVELTDRFYVAVDQRYPTPPEARRALGTGGLEKLEWTAPEARRGEGWTAKSDVFSLGLLLYKLLTGKRPFAEGSTEMISPRKFVPDCPRGLEVALDWALTHEPAGRCDAAGLLDRLAAAALDEEDDEADEFAEDLDGDLKRGDAASASIAAAPPRKHKGASPPARRSTLWVRRTARIAGALVLGALLWWGGRVTAPGSRSAEETSLDHHESPTSPRLASITTSNVPAVVSPPVAATPPDPLRTLDEALDAATPDLQRCAARSGKILLVEFTTAEDREIFAEVKIAGAHAEDVVRCVQATTDKIRFSPTTAQTFAEEYRP